MSVSENEIRIAVEAAGAEETQEEIQQTEESIQEAGEQMGDTSDQMEGLQQRMQGAGRAIAVAMAAAATGILSQVPVIGEVFSGLMAIFDALTFQLDQLLRDLGLGGLAGVLFTISEAIFTLEGPIGDLVGILTGLGATVLGVVGIFKTLGISLAPIIKVLSAVGSALLALEPITTAIIVGVAALIAAWVLFEDEIRAIVNGAIDIVQGLWNTIKDGVDTAKNKIRGVIDILGDIVNNVTEAPENAWSWFTNAISPVEDAVEDVWDTLMFIGGWVKGGVTKALDWLLTPLQKAWDLVEDTWDTLKEKIDGSVFESVIDIALELLPDASAFPGIEDNNLGKVSGLDFMTRQEALDAGVPPDIVDQIDFGGSNNNTGSGSQGFSADRRGPSPTMMLDGRNVTQNTGRYRRDGTARRNRNG